MLGGFDDQLPGYEDTEFWLSALEKGCKGEVIDEPLLRYRVRRGSRYHRAIGSKRFVQGMQQIYVKHWPTVGERFSEVLASKASFVAEAGDSPTCSSGSVRVTGTTTSRIAQGY